MKSEGSGDTVLTRNYAVGGYSKQGFENLSQAVDGVLGQQTARLQRLVETGAADTARR